MSIPTDEDALLAHALEGVDAEARDALSLAAGRAKTRLLRTLGSVERHRPFFADLMRLCDLDESALRGVLAKIDDPAAYRDTPVPGFRFFHFDPGPRAGVAEVGIVRVFAGAAFPRHRHTGDEWNYVLEGTFVSEGQRHLPGALVRGAAGTEHDYAAAPGRDLVLIAGHNGIEFVGLGDLVNK